MENRIEIWEDVSGYEGLYQVSNKGNVKSLNFNKSGNPKNLKLVTGTVGYPVVCLHLNSIQKNHRVHRLVADAFLENIFNKPTVNHINGIKNDNRVENLEWATVSENIIHSIEIGLKGVGDKCKNKNKYLTTEKVTYIRRLYDTKGFTLKQIANLSKTSKSNVWHIVKRDTWK